MRHCRSSLVVAYLVHEISDARSNKGVRLTVGREEPCRRACPDIRKVFIGVDVVDHCGQQGADLTISAVRRHWAEDRHTRVARFGSDAETGLQPRSSP